MERSIQSPGQDRSSTLSHGRHSSLNSASSRSSMSSWKVLKEAVEVSPIKSGDVETKEGKEVARDVN